ncbi:MAG: hypothetical protein WC781_00985 [Candidatus Pacearchaeota archaeon]|jgi:hypothetical protein
MKKSYLILLLILTALTSVALVQASDSSCSKCSDHKILECNFNHCDSISYYDYETNCDRHIDSTCIHRAKYYTELYNYIYDNYNEPTKEEKPTEPTQQPIQIINIQYPEDTKQSKGINLDSNIWIIGAIILGLLALIVLIAIIIIAFRR